VKEGKKSEKKNRKKIEERVVCREKKRVYKNKEKKNTRHLLPLSNQIMLHLQGVIRKIFSRYCFFSFLRFCFKKEKQ